MRNKFLTVAFALFGMVWTTMASAEDNRTSIYCFGFAANFNDSTVYFTDIQQINNAVIEKKTHFLENRDVYSTQLRDHFTNQGQPNEICVFSFAVKKKDIEKKYLKMKKKYTKNGKYDVKYISSNDFTFKEVEQEEQPQQPAPAPTKKEKKKGKRPQGMSMPGGGPGPGNGSMPPRR